MCKIKVKGFEATSISELVNSVQTFTSIVSKIFVVETKYAAVHVGDGVVLYSVLVFYEEDAEWRYGDAMLCEAELIGT